MKPAKKKQRTTKRTAPASPLASAAPVPKPEARPTIRASRAAGKTPAKTARPSTPAARPAAARKPATKKKIPRRPVRIEAEPAVSAKTEGRPLPPGIQIPPILLEGDETPLPPVSGPGQRYALAPLPPLPGAADSAEVVRLPESYGTQRMLLTARDPHWLYAHWDLSPEQQHHYNAQSRDRHLVLRVFQDQPAATPFLEIHVDPESHSGFVHVGQGGTRYSAEIGYFASDGAWHNVAWSAGVFTPPDVLSEDVSARFETLPMGVKFEELVESVKAVVGGNVPLMEALLQLRALEAAPRREHKPPPVPEAAVAGFDDRKAPARRELPPVLAQALAESTAAATIEWTLQRARALAQMVSMDSERRAWMGSLEITELIRHRLPLGISSEQGPEFARPAPAPGVGVSGEVSSVSSPFGGAEQRRGFWFNINAELVIYGATEPDATVTIGGRAIKLRPDGTFSYRFALPDGRYELPTEAVAADQSERRSAALRFSRDTEYRGEVAAHPQDSALRPPSPEHV